MGVERFPERRLGFVADAVGEQPRFEPRTDFAPVVSVVGEQRRLQLGAAVPTCGGQVEGCGVAGYPSPLQQVFRGVIPFHSMRGRQHVRRGGVQNPRQRFEMFSLLARDRLDLADHSRKTVRQHMDGF